MPTRVLTVMAGAPYGGAETFFVTLSTALKRAGLEVETVLRPSQFREANLKEGDVPFETLPFSRWFDMRTRAALRQVAQRFRPDVVLSFAGRASAMVPKGDYAQIGRLGGYYSLKNFRGCDHLVCNTPDLERYILSGGWSKDRVTCIPNFPHIDPAPAVDRALLGTPKTMRVALAMGRLHPNKAFDVLLRAAARVPDLCVWIAGEGPERRSLEALSRKLGIASRVKFLGWRTDRGALLEAADVCVVSSREEPMGNVVVEAWAQSVPLVAAASLGPKWLGRDGEDLLLVPIDDAVALADAIKRLLSSKGLADRLVANGKRRVEQEFSEERVMKRYIELFERLRAKR